VRDALTYLRLTSRLVIRNDAWVLLIPAALLIIVGAWTSFFTDTANWRPWIALIQAEIFGPFVAAFLFAGLLDAEFKRDAAEIVFSKPHPPVVLLGTRVALALVLSLAAILGLLLFYRWRFTDVPVWSSVFHAIAPCLFIGTVALTSGHFARSAAAGYAIPLTFWLWDTTLGMLYNPLYMLPVAAITEQIADAGPTPFNLWWTKGTMVATAALLFWVNVRRLGR
jgi:hypothetical protein